MRRPKPCFPLVLVAVVAGCAAPRVGPAGKPLAQDFEAKQVMKADVDRVADLHRRTAFASLRLLAEKLYKRNPREWRKTEAASIDEAVARLFDPALGFRHPALENAVGAEVIVLGLREDFTGDRVGAFISGLGQMMNAAFEHKTEFFLTDALEPQKLYNSARNVEIAAWKLANARDAGGQPLLLSNEIATPEQAANLSFEREFGKLIMNLDLLAQTVADRNNRTIARIVQNIATAVFLPVSLIAKP